MVRKLAVVLVCSFGASVGFICLDRTIIAWQNQVLMAPEHGFARWPTGRIDNPLVEERLAAWDRLGIGCPPGFCKVRAHAWAVYVAEGSTEHIVFLDYARVRPAHIRFRREVDSTWRQCASLLNC